MRSAPDDGQHPRCLRLGASVVDRGVSSRREHGLAPTVPQPRGGEGQAPQPAAPDPTGAPDTVEDWRSLADAMLSPPCCAFHRNLEISARYAWLYQQRPTWLKWAAMAAIASHHIRIVLFPLRLDASDGYVDLPRSLSRRGLLTEDANTIRETNNAIFDDVFWVHLAYLADDGGLERLRRLLSPQPHYASVLSAFELIDRGRELQARESSSHSVGRQGVDLVWEGNVALLDHEQRVTVQPHFDSLSRLFARTISMGATTSFELHGVREEARYFTSFYLYSITGGLPHALRARSWPRITRLEDRWRWLETRVVPRFRQLEATPHLLEASLTRVLEEARQYATRPCLPPASPSARRRFDDLQIAFVGEQERTAVDLGPNTLSTVGTRAVEPPLTQEARICLLIRWAGRACRNPVSERVPRDHRHSQRDQ